MTHPVLQEILRAKGEVRPEVLKRWQQIIRDEILNAPKKDQDA